jgi:glycine cleavage system H lipoate-binding protein
VQINSSPYEDGWLVKVKLSGSPDLKKLMNHEQYDEFQNAH